MRLDAKKVGQVILAVASAFGVTVPQVYGILSGFPHEFFVVTAWLGVIALVYVNVVKPWIEHRRKAALSPASKALSEAGEALHEVRLTCGIAREEIASLSGHEFQRRQEQGQPVSKEAESRAGSRQP